MSVPFDILAVRIGEAYRRGLVAYAEAGKMLADKKSTLKHGEWSVWLKANAEPLEFMSERTAQRLMKLAGENPTLTSDFPSVLDGRELTQKLWNNNRAPEADELPHSFEWFSDPRSPDMTRRVYGGPIDRDVASCQEANDKYVKALFTRRNRTA